MATSTLITDFDAESSQVDEGSSIEERQKSAFIVMGILIACASVSALCAFFVKEDLRRVNFKKEGEELDHTNSSIEVSTQAATASINQ